MFALMLLSIIMVIIVLCVMCVELCDIVLTGCMITIVFGASHSYGYQLMSKNLVSYLNVLNKAT